MKEFDLVGVKFWRLTILSFSHYGNRNRKYVNVICDCGVKKKVCLNQMKFGGIKSCGCLQKEKASEILRKAITTHNKSKSYPEYKVWKSMRSRCADQNDSRYGGKGIKVCKRWDNFEFFLKDMGRRLSDKHSIERKRVNGDYKPSNCRWATKAEQDRNRSNNVNLNFGGVKYVMQDFAKLMGVTPMAVFYRLKKYGKRKTLNHYKKILKDESFR